MPRKPPDPAALRETYFPVNDQERVEIFWRGATFAAQKFVEDQEAGRREAGIAALRLVFHLTDDVRVMAPFRSLLETHRPRRGPNGQPPEKWVPAARIAAATDGLMHLGIHQKDACEYVFKTAKKAGFEYGTTLTYEKSYALATLRTKYLNSVANQEYKKAPDPAAVKLFQHLRYVYHMLAETPWSIDSKRRGILLDLERHLKRLNAETPDEEGSQVET